MERTVEIPNGIDAEVLGHRVSVSGAKGKLSKDFSSPLFAKIVRIAKEGSAIRISTDSAKRKAKSEVGTIESHIKNMIQGVMKGYTAKLKLVYMHFPVTLKVAGKEVLISNFLGERAQRKATIVGDTKVEVKGDEIIVTGSSKDDVGQTAGNLERATWIKARDRRVYQDGIFVTEKS
jgi:large subunit ribosomal protein L6